ncbi:MAG: hypothetical protein QOJ16_798 [Acidobacteriota bacterium]|jgi:hypothetical protein|nr:hypothetical protein [Acidobacteriota bacterium]
MRSKVWLAAILLTAGALLAGCHRPAFLGGKDDAANGPAVCEGRYALCLSAACTPIPVRDAKTGKIVVTKALCECEVANGPSLGNLTCAARAPQGDGRFLVSAYSFGETAIRPMMTCPGGTAWASCDDQPCVVDPKDPGKAQCTCPVRTAGEYQTLGGNCDKSKCGTLWSAAAPEAMKEAGKLLAGAEGLKGVPANSCP